MKYQDLNDSISYITLHCRSGQRWQPVTLFSYLRRRSQFSFIGDYPIISILVRTAEFCGTVVLATDLINLLRQSAELKKYGRASSVLIKNLCLDI